MRLALCILLILSYALAIGPHASASNPVESVRPTSYDAMVKELKEDAIRSSLVKLTTIGRSAEGKRPIYMVQLGNYQTKSVRVLVLCRQHGDEPAGTEASLNFIHSLTVRTNSTTALRNLCLYIVPMVNPDGAEAETRLNGKHADLNRDWGVFHQSETLAVTSAVRQVRPQFILDIHSWDMIDPFQQVCLEGPRGSQVSPALLRSVADLQARAAYDLEALTHQNITATTYGTYSDNTLAHRYFLKTDHIASLLFETGPGSNYGTSLSSRTLLVECLLNWLLRDTKLHPDSWQRLASSEPKWLEAGRTLTTVTTIAGSPSDVKVSKHFPIVRWIFFGIACLILLWIAVRSHADPSTQPRLPARYRRLLHTSHAYCNWHQPELVKAHNRYGSVWVEHVYESLFRHIISIGTRYRILKATEQ